jgi:hypothetical protein
MPAPSIISTADQSSDILFNIPVDMPALIDNSDDDGIFDLYSSTHNMSHRNVFVDTTQPPTGSWLVTRFTNNILLIPYRRGYTTSTTSTFDLRMPTYIDDSAITDNNIDIDMFDANNDIDLAQRSFELALRADPQHALAHENLADVLLRQAQRHYQRAAQAPAPIPQRPLVGVNPSASAMVSAPRPNLGLAQKQQLLQPLLKLSGPTP